jgi:hypothetical protein
VFEIRASNLVLGSLSITSSTLAPATASFLSPCAATGHLRRRAAPPPALPCPCRRSCSLQARPYSQPCAAASPAAGCARPCSAAAAPAASLAPPRLPLLPAAALERRRGLAAQPCAGATPREKMWQILKKKLLI